MAILAADFVYRTNVGMIQRGRRLGLALKAGQGLGIAGHFCGQELERYKTVQARVFGLVHDTHPAAADFLEDAVVRDGLSDHAETRACAQVASSYGPTICESTNEAPVSSRRA